MNNRPKMNALNEKTGCTKTTTCPSFRAKFIQRTRSPRVQYF